MKRVILAALLLSACTESAPARPCAAEHEAVDKANAEFRSSTEWYNGANDADPYGEAAKSAWEAVNAAASHQTRANKALAACLAREAQ